MISLELESEESPLKGYNSKRFEELAGRPGNVRVIRTVLVESSEFVSDDFPKFDYPMAIL